MASEETGMVRENTELDAILNRLVDGLADEADERRLGELLRTSVESRQTYREFMLLNSALHWDYVAAVSPPSSSTAVAPAASLPAKASRVGWFVAFVAGVVVASLVALISRPVLSVPSVVDDTAGKPGDRDEIPVPPTDALAALLVDEVGAKFAAGRGPDGVRFGPGEYELLTGVVHLRFAQGADVVLASPARLEVQDAQHTRLVHGKVRVTAPPTARGFTIATRAADYVDLGTEFGLRVDPDSGASDLYVFDGQVNVADPRSGKVLSEVVEGNSSRHVEGAVGAAPEVDADEFPTPGAIGFQRWQQHERAMRTDDQLLAFYPFRRAADETVLLNAHDGMTSGRIEGAGWTTGRWPGKEALLFDRDTDFVQLDIPGEHQELTIAAWLKLDRLDFVFNAILNSDGYDLGHVHLQLTRQGHPRGGVAVAGRYEDRIVGSPVPLGQWTHVASVLSRETRSHRVYVNGVLTLERHWSTDQVLRPGSCRLGNWLAVEGDSVTNRALRGRVDELVIWSRVLSVDEIKNLVEVGRPGMLGSAK